MNNSLILRRRGFQAFQGWQFWVQVFIALSLFISVGVIYYITQDKDLFSKSFVYVPFAYAIFFYFQTRFMHRSKLVIDDFGLSHESGLPDLFKGFLPDWRISWAEIQSVEKASSALTRQIILMPLYLKLLNRTIKIIPNQWVDPAEESKKPWFSMRNYAATQFEENVLVKVFGEKGFLELERSKRLGNAQAAWVDKQLGTDINSSPISITMAGFLFFAIFYYIVEVYFTLSEFYAGTPPYFYMVIAAFIAVIISYLMLLKTKFAIVEKITLAVFMGFAMAAVSYPLMLRVNEWTDAEGLQTYSYVKSCVVKWDSNRQNYQVPPLKFDYALSDYWAQFEMGDTKDFELRKGGLGFYQLNMAPVYDDQKAFYENK